MTSVMKILLEETLPVFFLKHTFSELNDTIDHEWKNGKYLDALNLKIATPLTVQAEQI